MDLPDQEVRWKGKVKRGITLRLWHILVLVLIACIIIGIFIVPKYVNHYRQQGFVAGADYATETIAKQIFVDIQEQGFVRVGYFNTSVVLVPYIPSNSTS